MNKLDAYVDGADGILSVDITSSHTASVATAQVTCESISAGLGDYTYIYLGYEGNDEYLFSGYIKAIQEVVPEKTYTLQCSDVLIRAIDYFMVPSDPDSPFTRTNIDADYLIEEVLEEAGFEDWYFDFDDPQFTFATVEGAEVVVNLVSAYDFCKMIADLLAWNLWAEADGYVYFANRKPYVMDGTSGQPGDNADSIEKTIFDKDILSFRYREADRELRNRVVLHGAEGISATASSATSYVPRTDSYEQILPSDFYKSMALISDIIDNQGMANDAVAYNLALYNRVTTQASLSIVGDPDLTARKVIKVKEDYLGINSDWYIYTANHSWSRDGYTTNMELRR